MVVTFKVDVRLVVVSTCCGLIVLFAMWMAYPAIRKFYPITSSDLSGWAQAVGAIFAILFAAAGTRWQINKSKEHQAQLEVVHNIQMCEVCVEMCNAVISIIQSKQNALDRKSKQPRNSFEISYLKLSGPEMSEFLSLERLDDIQAVMRALLWKDMPADLLKRIFAIQKIVAQYKEYLIYVKSPDDKLGDPWTRLYLDSRKKSREITSEMGKISQKISEYKQGLVGSLVDHSGISEI